MLADDMQVADIGPPTVAGQPFSLFEDLDLDLADHLLIPDHNGTARFRFRMAAHAW